MYDYSNLNYSALSNDKLDFDDFTKEQLESSGIMDGSQNAFSLKGRKSLNKAVIIIAIAFIPSVMVISMISALIKIGTGALTMLPFVVIPIGIPALAIISTISIQKHLRKQKLRILRFALDNNLYYSGRVAKPPTEPIMFNLGHSRFQTDTLVFPNHSMLAKYRFTVGSGKSQRTYNLSFIQVKLSRKVPHLILDGRKNQMNLNPLGRKVQKLKLEGDFNKYFDVYIPPNYHIDALQLLTPDVMHDLIQYGQDFDFEFVDDELYIYHRTDPFKDVAKLRELLMSISKVVLRFNKQIKTYSDTRAGNVASGLVHESGARMVHKWNYTEKVSIIITIIIVVVYLAYVMLRMGLTLGKNSPAPAQQPPQQQYPVTSPIDACYNSYRYHNNEFILQDCLDRFEY